MPKITAEYIQQCAKKTSVDLSIKVSPFTYQESEIKRMKELNTPLSNFITAYFNLKLMGLNDSMYKERADEIAGDFSKYIEDKFELKMPLDSWFNDVVDKEEINGKVFYKCNPNKEVNLQEGDLVDLYGTEKLKTFYKKNPDYKVDDITKYNVNQTGFINAKRNKDDLAFRKEKKSLEDEIKLLKDQDVARQKDLDENLDPANWSNYDLDETKGELREMIAATAGAKLNLDNPIAQSSYKANLAVEERGLYKMYAQVRQHADNRPWYDYLLHPVKTFQEYSLRKNIENRLINDHKVDANKLDDIFVKGKSYIEYDIEMEAGNPNTKKIEELQNKLQDVNKELGLDQKSFQKDLGDMLIENPNKDVSKEQVVKAPVKEQKLEQ